MAFYGSPWLAPTESGVAQAGYGLGVSGGGGGYRNMALQAMRLRLLQQAAAEKLALQQAAQQQRQPVYDSQVLRNTASAAQSGAKAEQTTQQSDEGRKAGAAAREAFVPSRITEIEGPFPLAQTQLTGKIAAQTRTPSEAALGDLIAAMFAESPGFPERGMAGTKSALAIAGANPVNDPRLARIMATGGHIAPSVAMGPGRAFAMDPWSEAVKQVTPFMMNPGQTEVMPGNVAGLSMPNKPFAPGRGNPARDTAMRELLTLKFKDAPDASPQEVSQWADSFASVLDKVFPSGTTVNKGNEPGAGVRLMPGQQGFDPTTQGKAPTKIGRFIVEPAN